MIKAALVIEIQKGVENIAKKDITEKAQEVIEENGLSESISEVLFLKDFPVDLRHNAKIKRKVIAGMVGG